MRFVAIAVVLVVLWLGLLASPAGALFNQPTQQPSPVGRP